LRSMILIKEGLGASQIADTLHVSGAAISKIINSLETKNILKRSPGKDGRSICLRLTPKGQKTLSLVSKHAEKEFEKAITKLSPSEKESLNKGLMALEKLMSHMNEV
jgi:DNA-binding MarR family transcriptional regulator